MFGYMPRFNFCIASDSQVFDVRRWTRVRHNNIAMIRIIRLQIILSLLQLIKNQTRLALFSSMSHKSKDEARQSKPTGS